MAAGKLRHPSIPRRTAFRVAVQHEDRARFAPGVGEVVDRIVKIEIWWNAQCGHDACPFRFSHDRCARTLPPSCAQVHNRDTGAVNVASSQDKTKDRTMPKGYWIPHLDVSNSDGFQA